MKEAQVLIDSLSEPLCMISGDGVCLLVNHPFAELLGFSCEELEGHNIAQVWPNYDDLVGASGELSIELLDRHGRAISARVSCSGTDPMILKVLASAAHGEAVQLHHKQRLETLGLLAGGVAHDFNNVLTGILGHLAYLKHVLPQNNPGAESLAAIEEGALKASGLTQQILNFSKLDASDELSQVDVGGVLSRIVVLLKSAIPADISLRVAAAREPFLVLGSEVHLAQIVINLIINARDAISGRGAIDVSLVPDVSQDEVQGLLGAEPPARAYGAIEVRDSGSGMSDEVKRRLFEPYFTTKNEGGTGLGLSTVFSIVKRLGGAINVDSELGRGSVFRIILPLVGEDRVAGEKSGGAESGMCRGRGERILVVDDEDAVRNVLALSLSHLGYEVDTAASGLEGLERFQSDSVGYHLVILDLLMPGLSGEELFNRIRAIDSMVPVLIVSGFSSEHVVQRLLDDGASDFIQKPFSIEILSEKVRGCLELAGELVS
jgi:two-component system cell cycle sensor histidine kinase/response regulator CckA